MPLLPYIAALVATAWLFRSLADGRLPGNIGDARWTISFHEHWYDVWRGRTSLRNLSQFYPYQNMLGSTDPLLAQGQVYSAARVLGLGLIEAWVIAQIATFLFGMVGMAAVSKRFLATPWAQVAFVLIAGVCYPVALQTGHVQLLAVFWPSWIVLALSNLRRRQAPRSSWFVLCALPPVLALSSWYVLVLSAFSGVVFGAVTLATLRRRSIRNFGRSIGQWLRRSVRQPWWLTAAVLGCVGWVAAGWIYLSGSNALPDPTWNDAVSFMPRWSDLVNASGQGGGVWGPLYREWMPGASSVVMERQEGFVPLLLVSLLVAMVTVFRSVLLRSGPATRDVESERLLSASIVCVVIPILFVVSDDGLSLFKPLWLFVPGFDSIRAPFRVQALIYALAIFVVVRCLERWAGRLQLRGARRSFAGWLRLSLVVLILAGLLIETNRKADASWTADDLLPPALREWVPQVRADCDAVIVLNEDATAPPWVLPIDAVIVSVLAEVPTPQGYGRAAPIGFPGNTADPALLTEWMRSMGFDGRACTVSSAGVEPVL